MFVADLGGEVAMGLRRLPTLANHCAQRASFALLQGKWIEFRELTYMARSKPIFWPASLLDRKLGVPEGNGIAVS